METGNLLSVLLGLAVLLPLCSFAVILVFGPRLGKAGEFAGFLATGAIVSSLLLSLASLGVWLSSQWTEADSADSHHVRSSEQPPETLHPMRASSGGGQAASQTVFVANLADPHDAEHDAAEGDHSSHDDHQVAVPNYYAGDWYKLGEFGKLRLTISYYIDSLTVCMFCMVTLIASCIHFYAMGYMHEELHDVTDHEVVMSDGSHLHRPGRYHRFFQALSLFCFSMLGLVVSGNIAMTFIFWELVGICSYFLIGFYVERHSASTAANKAFIVNRVGDFGMIIGLMILWSGLGTFSFGDIGDSPGIFSLVRPGPQEHPEGELHAYSLIVPEGMVRLAATKHVAEIVGSFPPETPHETVEAAIADQVEAWRDPEQSDVPGGYGYWLLVVAGIGIFCGCVGKSAQFPLHVWLPDAMEGPTPVSALVHSATMVAAGVFLVARFYPVFTPEVLLVIAVIGCITLFLAATIAITATDIKRVLAYSTVSQLGYMMLALGVGGWLAGVMHLFTHAFFKSLLFMCSGSVIHAVHTNEMPLMGGLRKKMPWTAYTMLIGCLAIAGAGIPFLIGFSGYYSKDAILEQSFLFKNFNSGLGNLFFFTAAGGASITAFYMFRLWYMTFAGKPRDAHRYDHAHESPPVMYVPLVVLAVFAVAVAWRPWEGILGAILAVIITIGLVLGRQWFGESDPEKTLLPKWSLAPLALSAIVFVVSIIWYPMDRVVLAELLEDARPAMQAEQHGTLVNMTWPDEHQSHAPAIKQPATVIAFSTALAGFLLATMFYGVRKVDPAEVRKQFSGVHRFLLNKWWFDELYDIVFVRPTHVVSGLVAKIDRQVIDGIIDGLAWLVRVFSTLWEKVADQTIVDGFINWLAARTYATGAALREVQTGRLRQYVLFIVVGVLGVFVLVSFFWSYTFAG